MLDGKPLIVELIRKAMCCTLEVLAVRDMEGMAHVDGNRYVVVDEHYKKIILIEMADDATIVDVTNASKISLGITSTVRNKDFQGICWDEHNKRLLVV